MEKPNSIILKVVVEIDGHEHVVQSADYTESFTTRGYSWRFFNPNEIAQEVFEDYKESDI